LLLGASPARADTATCTYDAATHTATMLVTAQPASLGSGIAVSQPDGVIRFQSGAAATPCGAATRTNTDTIVVTSTNASSTGSIFRIGPSFAGGFTNEPGSSDEIELSFDFTSGGRWYLTPSARLSTTPLDLALGGNQLNLNRSEVDGLDADATVLGAEAVFVEGSLVADAVLAGGGFGTTGPFTTRLVVASGPGADVIVGGARADDLSGGLDPDVISGGKGRDDLKGEGGIDRLFGNSGNDKLLGGPARDRLNGGAGRGDRCTTKKDKHKGCEIPASDKKPPKATP
jgi:hypothetical protein